MQQMSLMNEGAMRAHEAEIIIHLEVLIYEEGLSHAPSSIHDNKF